VSGPLLRLGKDEVERLDSLDVRGRLCFVDLPTSVGAVMGRNELAERLDRMGAAAMIVVSNYSDTVNTKIVRSPDLKQLAVIVVSIETARELAALGALPCVLRIEAENFQTRSSNVVARPARRGARKVAVCAHYDTAPGISGACDNASGVAVMLECARLLARNPGGCQLEFIAFGGEEFGQRNGRPIGSDSYVDRHRDELRDIVCLLDIDTVGTTCCGMTLRFHGPEPLRDAINTALRPRNTRVEEGRPDGDGSAFSGSVPTLCFRNSPYEQIRIHSPKDNLDLLDFKKLSEACSMACDVMAGIQ
jgi:aminopeptidase YwaD